MKAKRFALFLLLAGALTSCSHFRMATYLVRTNPTENDPQSATRGRSAFLEHCASCHGANADGKGPNASQLSVPPTSFTDSTYTKAPWRIAAHIANGKRDQMPAFREQLSEKTIWDLTNYIRSLRK